MRTLVFCLLFGGSAFAENLKIQKPQWQACQSSGTLCYEIVANDAGRSEMSTWLFARNVTLKLVRQSDKKVLTVVKGNRGIWIPNENVWIISELDSEIHKPSEASFTFHVDRMSLTVNKRFAAGF